MDPKTKQLVEEAELLADSIRGPFLRDSIEEADIDFLENAPAKMVDLCSAVREQDKRARHAEQERDAFDKRIAELKAQLQERTAAAAAWNALAVARLKIINEQTSTISELEKTIANLENATPGVSVLHFGIPTTLTDNRDYRTAVDAAIRAVTAQFDPSVVIRSNA